MKDQDEADAPGHDLQEEAQDDAGVATPQTPVVEPKIDLPKTTPEGTPGKKNTQIKKRKMKAKVGKTMKQPKLFDFDEVDELYEDEMDRLFESVDSDS